MGHDVFTPEFAGWRFYGDGTETGASPLAAEDTNITVNVDGGDVQVQIRCMVQEIGGGSIGGATTDDYQLQEAVAKFDINASSSKLQADSGSSLTDGSATTNRATDGVTDGGGSFVAGEQEASNGLIEDHQLTADNFTEHVFAFKVIAADVVDAETLDLRLTLNGGNPGMTNTVVPRITIEKASAGTPIGLVTESDATLALSKAKSKAIGLNTETDQVFAITTGGLSANLGLLTEADLAQAFGKAKAKAISLVTESDLAQALSSAKARAVGLITENDLAQAVARLKLRTIGLITESDEVFAMSTGGPIVLGLVSESDVSQVLSKAKAKSIGVVTELDVAQVFGKTKQKTIGLVTESDLAQILGTGKAKQIGLASELDIPFALTSAKTGAIGLVSESNVSLTMTAGGSHMLVGLVTESDAALALYVPKIIGLGQVTETDVVFTMTAVILVTNVVARDVTFQVVLQRDARFAEAVLRDVEF